MNTFGDLVLGWSDPVDWEFLLKFDHSFFPRPWSFDQWNTLSRDFNHLFIWKQSGEKVGFALFSYLKGDDNAHLLKICLLPSLRGTGASQEFWAQLVIQLKQNKMASVYLEVGSSNLAARGFYRKLGFVDLRTIKNFYSDGESAITMSLTL